LADEQRKDGSIIEAQIALAARGHTLDAFLARTRADADSLPGGVQLLRHAASVLAAQGDQASALALWECVFDLGQALHDLPASDYLGLAAARMQAGNMRDGVELLRRMTHLPGDVYANYDLAAALLEEKRHDAEAAEFLAVLAKGVPWNASYSVRLARAQLHAGSTAKAKLQAALEPVAASGSAAYDVRVQAALVLRETGISASSNLGSEELRLLAAGKVAPEQAQQLYFAAARIAASDATQDLAKRALLLRQAIAVTPSGLSSPDGFAGSALRLRIFRAEAELGHDAAALNAIEPLLNGSYANAAQFTNNDGSVNQPADGDAYAADDSTSITAAGDEENLANLERLAPLPAKGARTEAEKLALAVQIAKVYERADRQANALPYLKLAAWLQKDEAARAELKNHIAHLQTSIALDAQNTQRRPAIRHALDQSNLVRPRLTKAEELMREEVQP
jgi:hypothetical protein